VEKSRRECGSCTLCCKLLPVKTIRKPANTRCPHQSFKGCRVYHKPEKGFPWECGLWNCVWLANNEAEGLRRPDHCHYVVDIMPDYVTHQAPDGTSVVIPVVQIWADPKYPDAHRDPALRAWLILRNGFCGLVRDGNDDGLLIVPPYLNDSGKWIEKGSNMREENHTFGQVLQALGAA
jgi:hypothetical protein